ncbi:MAG: NBR1-Ig-like domain-containing protein, partial [Chloroflexota bacterium]
TYARILLTLFAAFVLAACGNATPTPTDDEAMLAVYTAVGLTLNAQSNPVSVQSTSTSAPTWTAMAFSTPTPVSPGTATLPIYSASSSTCHSSAFVSDVTYSDGTEVAPGESFVKTWELKNTGTCAWDEDFLLTFYSGDDMDGEDTAIDVYVSSGAVGDVSVTLTAPDDDGTYTGYWMMADASGNTFGARFYVQIVVSSDLSTSTPTPTSTTEATSTSTSAPISTSTPVPTETTAPTETPTEDGSSG